MRHTTEAHWFKLFAVVVVAALIVVVAILEIWHNDPVNPTGQAQYPKFPTTTQLPL